MCSISKHSVLLALPLDQDLFLFLCQLDRAILEPCTQVSQPRVLPQVLVIEVVHTLVAELLGLYLLASIFKFFFFVGLGRPGFDFLLWESHVSHGTLPLCFIKFFETRFIMYLGDHLDN